MRQNIRRPYKRREERIDAGARFVIVCEGIKTERNFFHAIRKELRLGTRQIDILHAGVTNPRGIVDAVIERRAGITDWRPAIDTAWAVYDGVEHYRTDEADWHQALDIARPKSINLAISNPCFEFWYLIHFQDQFAWIERDAVEQLLRANHIANYDKAACYYPEPLALLTGDAIGRARQLAVSAQRNNQELPHCLCAEGVARLVEDLLKLRNN